MSEKTFDFWVFEPEQRKGTGTLDLSYWTYKVHAKTTLPAYPRKEMEVVRRYSDFEWFRSQLSEQYPFCIVPPIPEKDVQGTLNKFVGSASQGAARLRDYRQRALKKFLVRLGAHQILNRSQLLQDFLEMDEAEWERKMRATARAPDRKFAMAIDGMNHALTRQWNSDAGLAAAGKGYDAALSRGRVDPHVWEETRVYMEQLEGSIRMLRERVQMLVDRRRSTSNALHDFGVAFERVGEVERSVADTPLIPAINAVGQHSEQLARVYMEQASEETKQVIETLSYYRGVCAAVRETLHRVRGIGAQVEALVNQRTMLAAQRERILLKGGQSDRVAQLDAEIAEVDDRLQKENRNAENGEKTFMDELARFHSEKQYDMKTILKVFAQLQLQYAEQMRKQWEALAPIVAQVRTEEEGRSKTRNAN